MTSISQMIEQWYVICLPSSDHSLPQSVPDLDRLEIEYKKSQLSFVVFISSMYISVFVYILVITKCVVAEEHTAHDGHVHAKSIRTQRFKMMSQFFSGRAVGKLTLS